MNRQRAKFARIAIAVMTSSIGYACSQGGYPAQSDSTKLESIGTEQSDLSISQPRTIVAISKSPGTIDIFYRGADGLLYTNDYTGKSWSGTSPLNSGHQILGNPAVTSWGPNRLDVFVQGTDKALYTTSWNGSSWSAYTQLETNQFVGTPSAVSWGPNRIDVFVQGTDNTLYTKSWNGSSWSAYTQLGSNKFIDTPAVVSRAPNVIDVFVHGTDQTLYQNTLWNGTWLGYEQVTPTRSSAVRSSIAGDPAISRSSLRGLTGPFTRNPGMAQTGATTSS